jgi:hypothetical protein
MISAGILPRNGDRGIRAGGVRADASDERAEHEAEVTPEPIHADPQRYAQDATARD